MRSTAGSLCIPFNILIGLEQRAATPDFLLGHGSGAAAGLSSSKDGPLLPASMAARSLLDPDGHTE